MPAAPLIAPLPIDLVLASGYTLRVVALDPGTGAAVTGVRVTDVTFQVRPVNIGPDAAVGDDLTLPLLVPADGTG